MKKLFLLVAILCAFLVSGCATFQPFGGKWLYDGPLGYTAEMNIQGDTILWNDPLLGNQVFTYRVLNSTHFEITGEEGSPRTVRYEFHGRDVLTIYIIGDNGITFARVKE